MAAAVPEEVSELARETSNARLNRSPFDYVDASEYSRCAENQTRPLYKRWFR